MCFLSLFIVLFVRHRSLPFEKGNVFQSGSIHQAIRGTESVSVIKAASFSGASITCVLQHHKSGLERGLYSCSSPIFPAMHIESRIYFTGFYYVHIRVVFLCIIEHLIGILTHHYIIWTRRPFCLTIFSSLKSQGCD